MRDDLKWVRLFTPMHIPAYLIDQIKEKTYTTENFYKWQESVCLSSEPDEFFNPMNHLYALTTLPPNPEVKGFIWFTIEQLSKDIWIQSFSIAPELWNKGCAIELARDLVVGIRDKAGLNKIYWLTVHPKYSERYGFERSKTILMEFGGKDG